MQLRDITNWLLLSCAVFITADVVVILPVVSRSFVDVPITKLGIYQLYKVSHSTESICNALLVRTTRNHRLCSF